MSESLKPHKAEQLIAPTSKSLESLAGMRDKFDPVRAKLAAEQKKPVEELSDKEAAIEYLDLLLKLSQNFTSAEGKTSRVADYDKDGNINNRQNVYSGAERRAVGQLYKTITDEEFYDAYNKTRKYENDSLTWEDKYIDRELTIGMADDIIAAESEWRKIGEETTLEEQANEKAKAEKNKADAEAKLERIHHSPFGKLGAVAYKAFNKSRYNELQNTANREPLTKSEEKIKELNSRLQKALETAYSEDYGYMSGHSLNYEHRRDNTYSDKVNGDYNDKFFSDDRKNDIDRAIALRRQLESNGLIK